MHPALAADAALRGNLRDQRQVPHEQLGSAQGNLSRLSHAGPARNPAKKWRRCEAAESDLQDFQKDNAGLILPDVLDASGRCISLWVACLQIGQLLASQLPAQDSVHFLAN